MVIKNITQLKRKSFQKKYPFVEITYSPIKLYIYSFISELDIQKFKL